MGRLPALLLVFALASCGRLGYDAKPAPDSDANGPSDGAPGTIDAPATDATQLIGCTSVTPCVCPAGDICDFTCTDAVCVIRCEAGSECNMECPGASTCMFDCAATASCELDCRDGSSVCSGTCEAGAECRLRCNGDECREDDCPGGGVCNMSCDLVGGCVAT